MSFDVRRSRTLPLGFPVIAALALSITPALFSPPRAIAQSNDAQNTEPRQDGAAADSDAVDPNSIAGQTAAAQAAIDDAETKLDEATQSRDELEAENASQDQIDAANQAIAQARAQKEIAEQSLSTLNSAAERQNEDPNSDQ